MGHYHGGGSAANSPFAVPSAEFGRSCAGRCTPHSDGSLPHGAARGAPQAGRGAERADGLAVSPRGEPGKAPCELGGSGVCRGRASILGQTALASAGGAL